MAQNNLVFGFVWKTFNGSRGRRNLRIEMNQVTNLKSEFYMEVHTNYWESPQVFDPYISAIVRFVVDGIAELVYVSGVVEADDLPAPTL